MTYTYADDKKQIIIAPDGRYIPVCPGNADYDALVADGVVIADYALTADQKMAALRATRDNLLTATDKYLLADYPITADNLALIKIYRAALRDVPAQDGAPDTVTWPTVPDFVTAEA